MSDTPPGWAALLAAPLGAEPPVDAPLALLPYSEPALTSADPSGTTVDDGLEG
jgi:hypothetical protein